MVHMCISGIYVPFNDNNDAHMASTHVSSPAAVLRTIPSISLSPLFVEPKITKLRECTKDIGDLKFNDLLSNETHLLLRGDSRRFVIKASKNNPNQKGNV